MEPTPENMKIPPVIGMKTCQVPPVIPGPGTATRTDGPSCGAGLHRKKHSGLSGGWYAGFAVVSLLGLLFLSAIVGVTGYFRLGSETAALRNSVLAAVPGEWDKKIAIRVGWLTTALIRTGSHFFKMPPEPRAAFDAVHGVDVGVYQLEQDPAPGSVQKLKAAADKTMRSYGWDRIVGVSKDGQFVGVYCPHRKMTTRRVRCCVVVFQGRELVVTSASANLEPLLKLADSNGNIAEFRKQLAEGIRL